MKQSCPEPAFPPSSQPPPADWQQVGTAAVSANTEVSGRPRQRGQPQIKHANTLAAHASKPSVSEMRLLPNGPVSAQKCNGSGSGPASLAGSLWLWDLRIKAEAQTWTRRSLLCLYEHMNGGESMWFIVVDRVGSFTYHTYCQVKAFQCPVIAATRVSSLRLSSFPVEPWNAILTHICGCLLSLGRRLLVLLVYWQIWVTFPQLFQSFFFLTSTWTLPTILTDRILTSEGN